MTSEMVVAPVVLEGRHVRLEPLKKSHLTGLAAVGLDPELWRWIPTPVRTMEHMDTYIETALREQEQGVSLPFAQVERRTGRAVGSTRYGNIDRTHHRSRTGQSGDFAPSERAHRCHPKIVLSPNSLTLLPSPFVSTGCQAILGRPRLLAFRRRTRLYLPSAICDQLPEPRSSQ